MATQLMALSCSAQYSQKDNIFFQFFSRNKMNTIPLMTPSHASILGWSIDPKLARPEVTNDTLYPQLISDLKTILSR